MITSCLLWVFSELAYDEHWFLLFYFLKNICRMHSCLFWQFVPRFWAPSRMYTDIFQYCWVIHGLQLRAALTVRPHSNQAFSWWRQHWYLKKEGFEQTSREKCFPPRVFWYQLLKESWAIAIGALLANCIFTHGRF